jgi:hypothetical protein
MSGVNGALKVGERDDTSTESEKITWSDVLDHIAAAWVAGFDQGFAEGRNALFEDQELGALHQAANRVVQAMVTLDPHVHREQRRRESEREAANRHAARSRPWRSEAEISTDATGMTEEQWQSFRRWRDANRQVAS